MRIAFAIAATKANKPKGYVKNQTACSMHCTHSGHGRCNIFTTNENAFENNYQLNRRICNRTAA